MLKKIRANLTVKITIITMSLLMLVCFVTYAFIAVFIPRSYTSQLKASIDDQIQQLIADLKTTELENSGEQLIDFMEKNYVMVFLYDDMMYCIGQPQDAYRYAIGLLSAAEQETELFMESESEFVPFSEEESKEYYIDMEDPDSTGKIIEQSNRFSVVYEVFFSGSDKKYYLVVHGDDQSVNQALDALNDLLPWLILVIAAVSLSSAMVYARYITRPIIKISKTAGHMEKLDFEARCPEERTDEIGTLSSSLNHMSAKLGSTLSELQEANAALLDDIEKERELERQRMDFFAAVSHELKTPVTILKGQLEGMIRKIGIYKDRDKYLARCYDNVGNMEDLVAEILTISRIESDRLLVARKPVQLKELISECLEMQKTLLLEKNFRLETKQLTNISISGDPGQLKKVINNLLMNAIQYSPADHIIRAASGCIGDEAFFSFENTGIHIETDDIEKLFEPFYRLEKSRNRNSGGSGLGLYVVKKIVEAHGGRCLMENTSDGVKVTVFLQLHEKHK